MDELTIGWMNETGFYAMPFNAAYCRTDPLGYLDALRKGEDMWDLHVTDSAGRDVTQQYL